MTTHFALLLRPEAAPASSLVVRADTVLRDSDSVSLLREGRCVHRISAHLVLDALPFPTERAARDALLAHRTARVGGATIHISELSPPVPRHQRAAHGIPAEGLRIVIDES